MKRKFICLILVLISINLYSKTDWEVAGLKGKVKEQIEIEYEIKEQFGEFIKVNGIKSITKYNLNGNIVESFKYNSDGSLDGKYINKYNSNGNILEETEYNSDGSLEYKSIYKYDSYNNRVEEAKYKSQEKFGQIVEKLTEYREYRYTYYE